MTRFLLIGANGFLGARPSGPTGARPSGPTGARPSAIGVPAYFHPAVAPAEWEALARPGVGVSAVVLNVASGPGVVKEPQLAAVAERAAAAGVPVIGYVDTAYGHRSQRDLVGEMARYESWYGTSGFFLDQAASSAETLAWFRAVTDVAREFGGDLVVLNHGTYPDERYAELADALVTFEGPWAAYADLAAPEWARRLAATRFWHLVYDTPAALLDAALQRAASCNAGTVYVTDRRGVNPWDGLPSYFDRQLAAIRVA